MGEQRSEQGFRRKAERLHTAEEFPPGKSEVDDQAFAVGGDSQGIAGTAAAECVDFKHNPPETESGIRVAAGGSGNHLPVLNRYRGTLQLRRRGRRRGIAD